MSIHTGVATTALGVLELITLPTPAPEPDEVLIDAKYSALIPFDGYQLNYGYALKPSDYPRVLGFAGSGVVKGVGSNVTHVKVGDRVRNFIVSLYTHKLNAAKNRSLHSTSQRRRTKLYRHSL